LASKSGNVNLNLEDREATELAQCITEIFKLHGFRPMSPLTQAYLALGGTMGEIIGARITLAQMEREARAAQTPPPPDDAQGIAIPVPPNGLNGSAPPDQPEPIDPALIEAAARGDL